MNVASAVKTAKAVITANSPVLLLGTTIAGVVTTGILAARGGYRARGIIDKAEGRYSDAAEPVVLSVQEKAQLTWLCYAGPGVTAASTILSSVGLHVIHTKRHNAMAALYAVTSNKLDDMTERAEELLGPKKTQELQNDVGQKEIDRKSDDFESKEVMITGEGTELCFDSWSGRWFMGSMQQLESAVNDINRMVIHDGDASLNTFYDAIGLPPIEMGDSFGWSGPDRIDAKFAAVTSPDGRPAISIWFHKGPKENMGHP